MRKRMFVLCVLLVFALAACGRDKEEGGSEIGRAHV